MRSGKIVLLFLVSCGLLSVFIPGCSKDDPAIDLAAGGFPNDVGRIIQTKCATQGCHNSVSKDAAGGLDLSTWDKLFEGGSGGACVIPYRPDFSTLCYYINTYPDLGPALVPTMPYNAAPLSRTEVETVRNWIASGAPDRYGKVKFADNPNRKKIYVTNQGCDEVAVIDAQTKLVMRYIHVGNSSSAESPHMVKVAPDNQHWYVISLASSSIQKYRCSDDSYVGEINIGLPMAGWNTFTISANSRYAYISDWTVGPGQIKCVDLLNMSVVATYSGVFDYPHGTALAGNKLLNGHTEGNFIYSVDVTNPASPGFNGNIALDGGTPGPIPNLGIHDILLSPNGQKYFVTCSRTNEVRIMQTSNDSLLAVIPTGGYPLEMAVSTVLPYCFVTCEEDTVLFPGPGKKGCVTVFNYQNNQFVMNIDAGTYQPHGIAVDDTYGFVYVASRNLNANGPAPHHSSSCAGRNGFVTIIDLSTMQKLAGYKTELAVDPYSIAIRY
ncbi:MAG: c-type cytochrome domain-containing protein [Bacteroidota bacterium]